MNLKLFNISLAIVVIGGLEAYAISQGIDGKLMTAVVGAICLLAGVELKQITGILTKGKK